MTDRTYTNDQEGLTWFSTQKEDREEIGHYLYNTIVTIIPEEFDERFQYQFVLSSPGSVQTQ